MHGVRTLHLPCVPRAFQSFHSTASPSHGGPCRRPLPARGRWARNGQVGDDTPANTDTIGGRMEVGPDRPSLMSGSLRQCRI